MNNDTLPQLEQLIDQLISRNTQLESQLNELKAKHSKLVDENETLQLEILDSDEKQKETSTALTGLLEKLQSANQAN